MLILCVATNSSLGDEAVHLLYRGLLAFVHGMDIAVRGGFEV